MALQAELERLRREHGWDVDLRLEPGGESLWVAPGQQVSSAFDPDRHRSIDEAESTSWWYRTRNQLLLDLLAETGRPDAMWEVGAGSGLVARALVAAGLDVVAVEPGMEGARRCAQAGVPTLCATLEALELPDGCLPAVGLFDVLEHVDDRQGLLHEIRRVLAPDGLVVLAVPAFSWLWSGADEVAGHHLRYTRKVLAGELQEAGFTSIASGYRFASLVLPVLVLRSIPHRLGRRTDVSAVAEEVGRGPAGRLGDAVTASERRIGSRLPFGTSVFASARPGRHVPTAGPEAPTS